MQVRVNDSGLHVNSRDGLIYFIQMYIKKKQQFLLCGSLDSETINLKYSIFSTYDGSNSEAAKIQLHSLPSLPHWQAMHKEMVN